LYIQLFDADHGGNGGRGGGRNGLRSGGTNGGRTNCGDNSNTPKLPGVVV
jgi:hypothetical protein